MATKDVFIAVPIDQSISQPLSEKLLIVLEGNQHREPWINQCVENKTVERSALNQTFISHPIGIYVTEGEKILGAEDGWWCQGNTFSQLQQGRCACELSNSDNIYKNL